MIVETAAGRVRGRTDDLDGVRSDDPDGVRSDDRVGDRSGGPVTAFRGIPYARAERFAPPGPVKPWPGVREADAPGPAAPQLPSRLERAMGPFTAPQSEDCLSLNVWAPPGTGHAVLVFLHGGGFSSGAAGLGWYDGAELAAQGGIVVVTAGYRLGALGYLRLPGVSEGNLGLLDQLAALHWVRENIAAFGGDPGKVTVAGQSAGAYSILALLSGTRARGLFRRAILQSTPAGMLPDTPEKAEATGELLLRELGLTPDRSAQLLRAPVGDLLAAQAAVARRTARPLSAVPPFQLVTDGALVAADPVRAAGEGAANGVQVLLGTTRDEAAAFFAADERVAALGQDDLDRVAHQWFGDTGRAAPRGRTTTEVVVQMATDQMFRDPAARLVRLLTERGAPPWRYRFDWSPPGSPYGACHCIELPFVLGDAAAWRDAPMLAGGPPPGRLVAEVRRSWAGFVRDGTPGWPAGTGHHFTGRTD
ncbi:carboxylesterase family protein [Streptomyces sp. MST-110588]|uniref:carboxylesterase/lipase family protein n=1 Tax=Streptomyces sp. MST-110588 TaxID=2833628 RepID=UPI001F5CC0D3|nr:carboxylesterase family protein [Streptomyces sp. MST-110588]UNO43524.1 carboxylesterase family protein [Streptomyces sp. MST-110588]